MPIPLPSRMNAITRTANWISTVDNLPTELSEHIPKEDPQENKDEIVSQLRLLSDFGVEGAEAVEAYVDGEISESQLESRLDDCATTTTEHKQKARTIQKEFVLERAE